MRNAKKLLALVAAMASVFSLAACGKNDSSTESTSSIAGVDLDSSTVGNIVDAASSQLGESVEKLANPKVQWLAHYDINPADGKVEDPSIALFREVYGGEVEWVQTDWNSRYTKLASLVSANTAPDMFPADDMDAFPMGALKNMFQPIDDVIDLNDELWSENKASLDQFAIGDKHYVAVIETQPNLVCIYNTNTIDECGYDQPADLYKNGEWTWDIFQEYCVEFNDDSQEKYALDGFWYWDGITHTTGKPFIGFEGGKIVSNIDSPEIEKAQNFIYDLIKAGSGFPRHLNNWSTRGSTDSGSEGLGSGLTLFIPCGLYEIEDTLVNTADLGSVADGEVMFVPMPKMDENSDYYMPSRINGYCLVSGAPNPEGFEAFMRCKRICNEDEAIKQIGIDTLVNDYGWTQDMLDMREECYRLANEKPVFEFKNAVTKDIEDIMGQLVVATSSTGGQKTWAEARAENLEVVEYLIDEANAQLG